MILVLIDLILFIRELVRWFIMVFLLFKVEVNVFKISCVYFFVSFKVVVMFVMDICFVILDIDGVDGVYMRLVVLFSDYEDVYEVKEGGVCESNFLWSVIKLVNILLCIRLGIGKVLYLNGFCFIWSYGGFCVNFKFWFDLVRVFIFCDCINFGKFVIGVWLFMVFDKF